MEHENSLTRADKKEPFVLLGLLGIGGGVLMMPMSSLRFWPPS